MVGLLIKARTVATGSGSINHVNHAWVDGEISIGGYRNRPISVKFGYYYNPDPHSRGLEPEAIAKPEIGP